MRIGICLPGGGAKGAFQGGAIKWIFENGIEPEVVTGTSIGAINSYFMIKDAYRELEEFWTNMDGEKYRGAIDKTIDNSKVINELSTFSGSNHGIKSAYVNYVKVENNTLSEVVRNIMALDREEALNCVKYSSLLPIRIEKNFNPHEAILGFDSKMIFEYFKEDVANGVYEGYCLDGGILNNNLLGPFITNRVDKILIIALRDDFLIPEYILDYYDKEDIIVVKPDIKVEASDTIRFEREYCLDMYERGYRIIKSQKPDIK